MTNLPHFCSEPCVTAYAKLVNICPADGVVRRGGRQPAGQPGLLSAEAYDRQRGVVPGGHGPGGRAGHADYQVAY